MRIKAKKHGSSFFYCQVVFKSHNNKSAASFQFLTRRRHRFRWLFDGGCEAPILLVISQKKRQQQSSYSSPALLNFSCKMLKTWHRLAGNTGRGRIEMWKLNALRVVFALQGFHVRMREEREVTKWGFCTNSNYLLWSMGSLYSPCIVSHLKFRAKSLHTNKKARSFSDFSKYFRGMGNKSDAARL